MNKTENNILLVLSGLAVSIGLGILLLVSCGLSGYFVGKGLIRSGYDDKVQTQVGSTAPDFRLTTVFGESIHLSELPNRAILLNFWATWCAPCVEEMALLQIYSEKYPTELIILGINADEPLRDVANFVELNNLTFPVLLDPDSRVQDTYGIRAFPTSYFLNQDGVIRSVHIGLLSDSLMGDYLEQIGVGDD